MTTKKKQKLTGGHAVIIIVLVLLAIICFYPMWYTLIMSFSDKVYVDAGRTWLIPLGLNVKSYGKILKDSLFFSAMWVSVKRVIVGCAVSMFMLIITAYPLCVPEKKFPASKYIKWFFLANMMFSGGLIPFYSLMRQYNLFNNFWVLILPGALPLWNMILMMNFFRNVPYALNESATIDGANPIQILFKIYVPLSVPSIACLFLFQFVGHWNGYLDGLLYIKTRRNSPCRPTSTTCRSHWTIPLCAPRTLSRWRRRPTRRSMPRRSSWRWCRFCACIPSSRSTSPPA